MRYPGDTRKYCTAPAIRRYKFGVEFIAVPLAPRIGGRSTCGTKYQVPSAPELPAIVVMFSALRKPTQVHGMTAPLIACLPGWLLRLRVPDAWGLGTDSVKQTWCGLYSNVHGNEQQTCKLKESCGRPERR